MKESKLERHKPFLYGMADLGPASIDVFIKVYLLLFFNVIMGLSPSLTSLAIGLGVLWDALIDPWIGVYSDSYYHKNGHRKFVIYAATAVIVTLFFFMWRLPRMPELPTFILLFLISSFLNSALSLYSVPYIAIANDLEHDNEERKKWTGWRLAFLNLGAFFGLAVPGYILTTAESSAEPAQAYQTSSLVLCGIMCFVSFTSIYLVYRNRRFTVSDVPAEKRKRLIELIQDRTFLRVMTAYFVVNCGLGLNSALALYYYKDFLQFTEKQTQTILVSFLFVFTLSLPFWIFLTRHFAKTKLIVIGALLLGVISAICYPNFRNSDFNLVFLIGSVICGVLVGVAVVLEIYLSDFLKEKQNLTGQNVSGQYLGIWKMASKISRAVSIALAGPILEHATDKQVLANYFGGGAGLFFILGALVMLFDVTPVTVGKKAE